VVRKPGSDEVISGASLYVYTDAALTTLAKVWDAFTGGSSTSTGPQATSNAYGVAQCWVDPDDYDDGQAFFVKIVSGSYSETIEGITPLRAPHVFDELVQIPIAAAENGATPPESLTTIASSDKRVAVRKFAGDQSEDVVFEWQVPDDLVGATIEVAVLFYVTESTAPSSEGVAFSLAAGCLGNGDSLGAALGSAVESALTGRSDAQYDRLQSAWATLTPAALAAGETMIISLARDHDSANDTYVQDVGVADLLIRYKRKPS
jgi:hypothetical protein